jgi:hypothetical protein
MNKFRITYRSNHKVKRLMHLFITQKIYLLDGMESQSLIGCINFMDLEYNINAKFVETIATGEEEPFKCTFNNGGIITE